MILTDVQDEDYGPFGRVIGVGSFLLDKSLDEVVLLTSLELMRRATASGATFGAQRIFRHVLLAWIERLQAKPYAPREVTVYPEDMAHVSGLDLDSVILALQELSDHLPMTGEHGWHGRVKFDLSPWLPLEDTNLLRSLHRLWMVEHVEAVQQHCEGAQLVLDTCLDSGDLPLALGAEALRRLAQLRERRACWEQRRRLTRPLHVEEALGNLWAFHDEVAELEYLHDCVVGLLSDPDGHHVPFSIIWRSQGPAKFQALSSAWMATVKPAFSGSNLRLVANRSM